MKYNVYKELESELEIHLLLSKRKSNKLAFQFNYDNNKLNLVFDDPDICSIFLNYFNQVPLFIDRELFIISSGVVSREYKFSLLLDENYLKQIDRIIVNNQRCVVNMLANDSCKIYYFNLNGDSVNYLLDIIKQMFDESNNILNVEKLCADEN